MNPQKRRKIFERLRSANPNPTTELAFRTSFELLVSVVLSAQATDKSVNFATEKLYRKADTPQAVLALGHPTIAVDTHIFRVANRTGLAPGKDVREVEEKLLKFVPEEFRKNAHHWLILHGRYVCKARKPECPACIIRDLCEFRKKTKA